jgi:mycothiol synthase
MAVLPTHRREGVGHRIIEELISISADGRLRLWAHGESAQATQLAHAMGFLRSRILWQMRRSLFAELPACDLPAGITVSTFIPGRDETAWLDLNRRAFAHLPDQSNWQIEDLERRMQEEWFDAAGFLMAYRDDTLVGFHWTKVHGGKHQHTDSSGAHHDHDAIGEVYVIAVDPTEQGTGLGRALTIAGLGHLRDLGLSQAMLYVDASNTRAVAVYENLGFSRWDTDVLFIRQQFPHS